jgi:hypothetical protein
VISHRSGTAISFGFVFLLAACASDPPPPKAVDALGPEQKASLRIAEITDEAVPGLVISQPDLDRILQQAKTEISLVRPDVWSVGNAQPGAPVVKIRMVITKYVAGDAGLRFLSPGLGRMEMGGDVLFSDALTGGQVAKYQVFKEFSGGGIWGASTSIQDVQKGFARSVALTLTEKK